MENINDYMPLSSDLNKERLETLKKLFPDLFTNEGKLNIDELKKVVDPKSVSETERYEFRWFGKSNAKREAFTPTDATLVYDEHRSVNPTESENIIIEGENLAVLKLLSNSYREQVKCIYIDPPYNTGKDFVYSDKFNQDKKEYWEDAEVTENGFKIDTNTETDGRFHSNWLNMMYSRLLIARQLLKEDGVIFISIDDNEVHHLRKLCDEVFGEENFLAIISRVMKSGGAKGKFFTPSIEYILVYAKNYLITQEFRGVLTNEQIERYYNKTQLDGNKAGEIYGEERLYKASLDPRPNQRYWIKCPDGSFVIPPGKNFPKAKIEGEKIAPTSEDGVWKWIYERYKTELEQGNIVFKETTSNALIDSDGNQSKWNIYNKLWLNEQKQKGVVPSNFIGDFENRQSSKELKEIEIPFDFAKPSALISYLIQMARTNNGDLIFDFFGGSGTTGQAVMELNNEDGGNRKYILVQIPEATDEKSEAYKAGYKKISDITIERNKRVVEKIQSELRLKRLKDEQDLFKNQANQENPTNHGSDNLGFKVFKLVKSNFPRVEFAPDPEKTDEENIELLKKYISDKEAQLVTAFNRDELMTEILLKKGFNLNYTSEKQKQFKKNEIYLATDPASGGTGSEKETLICLDVTIEMETVEYFKKHTDKKFICLERALDTTKKYNLKHYMGDMFNAF